MLANTRDFGTAGLNNATIKEMLEKAEGKPVNTINLKAENTKEAEPVDAKKEAEPTENTSKEISQTALRSYQLAQSQMNSILLIKNIKEEEYDKLQKELEEKKEQSEELMSKIKDNACEDTMTSYSVELSSLQDAITSIQSSMSTLEPEINSLNSQYNFQKRSVNQLKLSQ